MLRKTAASMEEIDRFVSVVPADRFTITKLCEQFGISRKTGYKHMERYAAGGLMAAICNRFGWHRYARIEPVLPRRGAAGSHA